VEICAGDFITIGGLNAADQKYLWEPGIYLNDSHLANPGFVFNDLLTTSRLLTYVLTSSGDGCARPDTMNILVHPKPEPVMYGSSSVCPGTKEILYWTNSQSGFSYAWAVEGGVVSGEALQDTIRVNWGQSNADAKVKLIITNEFKCQGDQTIFPVRINVQLETETPKGLSQVCSNLRNENLYQIGNTNGSVYTWGIDGGIIQHGQGSSKILVDWSGQGEHMLWVAEKSVTQDTICFGRSDTLKVKVYTDSLQAIIDMVTVTPSDESIASISGNLFNASEKFSSPVNILRKVSEEETWTPVKYNLELSPSGFSANDINLNTDDLIFEYQIQTINECHLDVFSDIHHTIQLKAKADESSGKILLQWNAYDGWRENVLRYEIWRKIDGDSLFTHIASTAPDDLSFELSDGDKGFKHQFILKAIARGRDFYSWSNQQEVSFIHALSVPNVFTPNNDQLNETFDIPHIELYPENEIVIYNRYGKEVFRKRNYKGDWTGNGLSTGVYYYVLSVVNARPYKGWVQLLR
jgi:gliding motility-associated-like protein